LVGGSLCSALLLGHGGAVPLTRLVGGGLLTAAAGAQREHGGGRQDGASGEDRPRHDVLLVSSYPQRNRRSEAWRWGELPIQNSPCRVPHGPVLTGGGPLQDGQVSASCPALRRPKSPTSSRIARMSRCVRSQWFQTWP